MLPMILARGLQIHLVHGGTTMQIKRLISIKRIFSALAIGGALLFGVGAASAQTFHRTPSYVYDHDHDRDWRRDRRREEERERRERNRWERDRWEREHRGLIHSYWHDRWGFWHRY